MSGIQALLEKADRSLKAAEILAESGSPDFAASRAYYGCFYVAEALLLTRGQKLSSHGQVISQYGLIFARTGELDRRFHHLLLRAFKIRQFADYEVEVPVGEEEAMDLIRGGREFLKAASDYLAHLPEPPAGGDAEP
ncbi:MAG TPA: HEPN domain-containing protein [Thermoanaerobaculia bacterium]